jgi:hypothetical protein
MSNPGQAQQGARQSMPNRPYDAGRDPRSSAGTMNGGGSTIEELSAAGLRSARKRSNSGGGLSALTVAGAFLVGVLAVVGVVVGVHAFAGPSADERQQALVVQAESALAAHRWDGDDGVRATTDHILAEHPDDADALRIRHDAAELMIDEGDRERDRGHDDTARERYSAADALDSSSEAHARLDALEHPAPHREQGIVISPSPVEREQVIVTATVADGHTLADTDQPRFVLVQTHRHTSHTITAAPTGIEGAYSATYVFPQSGPYEVQFHAGDYTFATTIEVARGARPAEQADPPITTQGSLGPPLSPIPSIVDAPIIHSLPSLPSPFTTASPVTTPTHTDPPPIQPLPPRPPPTTTTTTTPPSLPPAWTSTP